MNKKLLWVLIVVAVGVGVFFLVGSRGKPDEKYRTATVDKGDITMTVTATGALSAVTTVKVGSQVSGIIAKLHADFNSAVKKGDMLAELDPTPFQEKVNALAAALDKAQVEQRNMGISLNRQKALRAQGLSPEADYDAAQANYDSARASVAQASAALKQAKTDLDYTKIEAPIDGVVVDRQYDVGQTVAASFQAPTLFTIAQDLTKMQVSADTSESDIGKIKLAQPVRFTVDAYPEREFRGRVSQIRLNATVNQNVVTYPVIVEVSNEDLSLRPTMTANVSVDVATVKDVLRIPNAALRWKPEVKPGDTSVETRAAKTGQETGTAAMNRQFGETRRGAGGTGAAGGGAGGAGGTRGARGAGEAGGAGGRGQGGGGRGAGPRPTIVYEAAAPKGDPKPVKIRTGISDGRFTQVVEGELKPGDAVIVGLATAKVDAAASSIPGAPRPGGPGGGGGRRGF